MLQKVKELLGLAKHCPECETLIDYAMDGLEAGQAERVKAHLLACPPCMEQMRDYMMVGEGLALGAPPAETPEGLCGRVKARIHAELDKVPPPPGPSLRQGGWPAFWMRLGPVFAVLSVGMTMLAASAMLLRGGGAKEPIVAGVEALLADPGTHRVELASVDGKRPCKGLLMLAKGSDLLLLKASRLHPCPWGRSYVVWMERGAKRERLAAFQVEDERSVEQLLRMPRPLDVSGPVTVKVSMEEWRQGRETMRGELALAGNTEF